MSNHLKDQSSPYLLQHAENPVDWYPWGEEAFEKAKREDKPVFLSIGYSTCHWCHVMEQESFENMEIADILNRYFVSIKVDREERPDIDSVYMSVCQALTGNGGWPMSIFMTPEQKPFFAGTYFPPISSRGMAGMHDLLFLTLYAQINDKKDVFKQVEVTLEKMRRGGIFDHIGFGFSRYSTDKFFFLPHFEKMLYDNVLLIIAYSAAYKVSGNEIFLDTAEKTAALCRCKFLCA